jgi:rhamnosyltransferase
MNTKISIVIRCYNEEKHIGTLLDKLKEQTLKDLEIIVVDSGSQDNTLQIVSQYPARVFHINPRHFTFGRSLNIGCDAASGDIIVITSPHCYPTGNDWIERLSEPFSDQKVALVYGKQRGDKNSKFSEQRIFKRWFPKVSEMNQDHPFCNNANIAIRCSIWEKLPYDESLTGLEDIDWAKRALALGYKIIYKADAGVIHIHEESPKRIYRRYEREAIAFKRIFPEERFNIFTFFHLFISNVLHDSFYAIQNKVLWYNLKSIIIFRFMQFLGTYKGFKKKKQETEKLKTIFYYPK